MSEGRKRKTAEVDTSRAFEVEKHPPLSRPGDWITRLMDEWAGPNWLTEPWRTRILETIEPIRVEEFEEGQILVVKAEMPGLDPDKDVEIDITDRALHIHAERRQETRTEETGHYRSEFRYGSFTRTVPLPFGVTEKDVKATYNDGILEVRVPLDKELAKGQRVPIDHS